MHLFADESGNTGREIFNEPEFYHAGAIIAVDDIDDIVRTVIEPEVKNTGSTRFHANESPASKVAQVARKIIDALDKSTKWTFHATRIQKPYIATTKFVDTVFDNGENIGARAIWYQHQYFRHTICCAIDDMLTDANRKAFWDAFLANDHEAFTATVKKARSYLDRCVKDRRLHEVILDAFKFAERFPEEITLGGRGRRAYRGHTPNMIAFSVLMDAAHKFADRQGVVPETFIHDEQKEFGGAMAEVYKIFSLSMA